MALFREILQRSAALALAAALASCASGRVSEQSYTPGADVVKVKSDLPLVRLWDRWEERDSGLLLAGTALVSSDDLPAILSDDPSPEVMEKMKSYRSWTTTREVGTYVLVFAATAAAIGYSKGQDEERAFSIPVINALWALAGAGAVTDITGRCMSARRLDEALALHNARLWKNQSVAVTWEASF